MRTRLIFLLLLIVSFSCGTNNKPVSDAQEEKIVGEVKEIVHSVFKGAEEANFDMVVETWYDSPDFVYMCNGKIYNYKECMDEMEQFLNVLLNQKCTIVYEKYAVLDNSTVLGTINTKWLMNYKDGHSVLQDPWAVQFTFKKIDNRWRVIYHVESGVEKGVSSESSKGLNQAELLKKFIGNWEILVGKDTSLFIVIKNFKGGNGLYVSDRLETKGKVLVEGTGFWAYDAGINKVTLSLMRSNGEVTQNIGIFTSPTTYEYVNVNNSPNYIGVSKCIFEFVSPDEIKGIYTIDNKEFIQPMKRIK
jgi:hypothetical protein